MRMSNKTFMMLMICLCLLVDVSSASRTFTITYVDTNDNAADSISGVIIDGKLYELDFDDPDVKVTVSDSYGSSTSSSDDDLEDQDLLDAIEDIEDIKQDVAYIRAGAGTSSSTSKTVLPIDEEYLVSEVDTRMSNHFSTLYAYYENTMIPKQNEIDNLRDQVSEKDSRINELEGEMETLNQYLQDEKKDNTYLTLFALICLLGLVAVVLVNREGIGSAFDRIIGGL